MKKTISILVITIFAVNLFSQSEKILMTINGKDITTEEFKRVYTKNNNITPNTEQKSVDDYIDLFINYKLKVIEAENKGYDTMKTFLDEFDGYTKQLAKPYLQNQKLKDKLIKESYERSQYEINASHILIRVDENALPEDTTKAYEKISEIRARINGGEPFEEVARATSDDQSVKQNGGNLGYFSVFRMVYPFECGAYNTPVGKVSTPVRTQFGYHIIKVNEKRPARGSIEVAHIMTRVPRDASAPEIQAAEEKIQKAYHELMDGSKWEDIVSQYSEHQRTKENNGNIGWLKTGQAPEEFMEVCYKLEVDGISKPIRTQGGFHIAKILDKKGVESFEESKERLAKRVDGDKGRRAALVDIMDKELMNKYGFEALNNNAHEIANVLDSGIYLGNWDFTKAGQLKKPILKNSDISYTQYDYAKFLADQSRFEMQRKSFETIATNYIKKFISEKLNEYAINQLPKENLEYKYLLQEYHDGILLFNLTNDMVWKKAQEDSLGLEAFYKTTDKYQWDKRIDVVIYEYTNNDFTSSLPKLAKKQAKKKLDDSFIIANLCPEDTIPCITISKKTYEKGHDAITEKIKWEKGSYTVLNNDDAIYFYYIVDTHPVENKKLNEARGLYIADYQTFLEEKWVGELREKYNIKVNNEVLGSLKEKLNQ